MNIDLKILCSGFEFEDSSLEFDKRNLFNIDAARHAISPAVIDLSDFLLELPKFTNNKITLDNSSDKPLAVFEYGDVVLKLSGMMYDNFLRNYFLVYDASGTWSLRKYIIEVKYNNVTVFNGVINNDSLRYPEGYPKNKNEKEVITLQARTFDKEHRDWLKTKLLPAHNTIFDGTAPHFYLPWYHDNRSEDNHSVYCSSMGIEYFFLKMLAGQYINTVRNLTGADYHICNIPQLYRSDANGEWYMPSGYKRWWQEGITCLDFINYLQSSWGWMFEVDYYYNALTIKNRSESNLPVVYLDFNDVAEWEIGASISNGVKNIIIPSGQMKSKTGIAGFIMDDDLLSRHFKMIASSGTVNNQNWQFSAISGAVNSSYALILPNEFRFSVKTNENNKLITFADARKISEFPYQYAFETKYYNTKDTLVLNAGEQTAMKTVCNITDTKNYPSTDFGADWQDILFHGSVGDCVFIPSASGNTLQWDFHRQCKTSAWRDNFVSLLEGGAAKTVELTYNDALFNPNCVIRFVNVPDTDDNISAFFSGDFAVNSLETDLKSITSKFTLVRK